MHKFVCSNPSSESPPLPSRLDAGLDWGPLLNWDMFPPILNLTCVNEVVELPRKARIVEQEYYYDATPDKVFKALTVPKELKKWFLGDAKIRAKEGSTYKFTWKGGFSHIGKVEKVETDRELVLTWPDKINNKVYETRAAFTMKKKGRGTLLKVKHTGFKDGEDWIWLFGGVQSGWAYYLTNLKSVLSQGVDLRSEFDSP